MKFDRKLKLSESKTTLKSSLFHSRNALGKVKGLQTFEGLDANFTKTILRIIEENLESSIRLSEESLRGIQKILIDIDMDMDHLDQINKNIDRFG